MEDALDVKDSASIAGVLDASIMRTGWKIQAAPTAIGKRKRSCGGGVDNGNS